LTSHGRLGKVRSIVRRHPKSWSAAGGVLCLVVSLLLGASAARAEEPAPPSRSVLLLYGFDPFAPVVIAFDDALHTTLLAEGPPNLTVHNEVLDLEVLADPEMASKQLAWFRAHYGVYRPELVVAAGTNALQFVLDERHELWPGVPVVYTGVDEEVLHRMQIPPDVTGVARRPAVGETLELALQLLPGTRRVAFFGGTSPVDRAFEAGAREELKRVTGHLEQLDLAGLPLAEMAGRMATLPPETIVIGVSLFRDGTGRNLRGTEALHTLASRSSAPIFSTHAQIVGFGIVGGWVTDYVQMGVETGRLAAAVLGRAPGAPVPPPAVAPIHPVVDARQLERWHIPDSRLPPGTEILFREPSLWGRYRWTILSILAALAVESALIAFLLVERRRRRAAEAEARANQERIAHINRVGTIAELSGSLAHELSGPLGSVMNNARAARKFLVTESPDLKEVRASLVDIENAAERAGQVIRRLRTVLRKDEFRPGRVTVASVVQDAVRLVHSEAARRRVTVEVAPIPGELAVSGDEILLLQILLNLLLNSLDAVAEQPPGRRRVAIGAAARGGAVEVTVSDSGSGIPESALEGIFEPFFTTKAQGLGMGLPICRSIAEAHGGRIVAENRPEGGALVRVSLPAAPGDREAAA
jgi:signal transduction histidine kinase